jgi:hypothetical protein
MAPSDSTPANRETAPNHSTAAGGPNRPARLLRADQRQNWLRGLHVRVEDYLQWLPGLADDGDAVLDLICGEFRLREELGERPTAEEYLGRFPQHAAALRPRLRAGSGPGG